jgi:hypothetical protein
MHGILWYEEKNCFKRMIIGRRQEFLKQYQLAKLRMKQRQTTANSFKCKKQVEMPIGKMVALGFELRNSKIDREVQ